MTSDYKSGGVSLSNILHNGSSSITGYSGATGRTTGTANSKPLTTGFQINGTDIANNYTAKHIILNATDTISKPTGATKLRYMIIGGSGGGGGGGGGGYHDDSGGSDHALLGYNGNDGYYGEVRTGEVDVTGNVNVVFTRGNGGNGGNGGAERYGTGDLYPGNNGQDGSSSILTSGPTTITCNGGNGGYGGVNYIINVYRRIENNRGGGSSWIGWGDSTQSTKASNGGGGNTTYGYSDNGNGGDTDGNSLYTSPTVKHNQSFSTNWEDSLTEISSANRNGGTGGNGGWGYGQGKNANAGNSGNTGSDGRASIIWLYD
jgi:hypothetical protein